MKVQVSTCARKRTIVATSALGAITLVLAALLWAQFQVNQDRGFVQIPWRIDVALPLQQSLQACLDKEMQANPHIHGQLVHIIAPSLSLDTTLVSGAEVAATDAIRVASNTKTFVAGAALKLVETGRLNLDTPIEPYLSQKTRTILVKADRDIERITLRQLLNHTSGIADYGSSRLFQVFAYVPTTFGVSWHWTGADQIWIAANLTPNRPPGIVFDYSDTNYLLVADMIATATATPNAGIALRQLLVWPALGANSTYWEGYEAKPPQTRRMRQFRGAIEDTNLNVSFDQYGGGGLVMRIDDLARAHRAVVRGDIFTNAFTMTNQMRRASNAEGSGGYALGLVAMTIEGETCYAHGGRWGTHAFSCPDIDLTVSRSWGQGNASPDIANPSGLAAALVRHIKVRRGNSARAK